MSIRPCGPVFLSVEITLVSQQNKVVSQNVCVVIQVQGMYIHRLKEFLGLNHIFQRNLNCGIDTVCRLFLICGIQLSGCFEYIMGTTFIQQYFSIFGILMYYAAFYNGNWTILLYSKKMSIQVYIFVLISLLRIRAQYFFFYV